MTQRRVLDGLVLSRADVDFRQRRPAGWGIDPGQSQAARGTIRPSTSPRRSRFSTALTAERYDGDLGLDLARRGKARFRRAG